uniref:TF-B3 domain-containing protein n=1 Tax=Salix viminalis TaxID=40686 RepID=A0A6N2KN29_SALVM
MEIFSKELKDTDDSRGELRVIRCLKRNGDYDKRFFLGLAQFVADYGLRVGDRLFFFARMTYPGSQFRIQAQRRIVLLGRRIG